MKWKWGNVPIPIQHLAGLILGAILQALFPRLPFLPSWMGYTLGLPLAGLGIGLIIWSVLAAGDVDIESPPKLVFSGPYARSRNPMMVAWTLLYLGIGLVLSSFWILVLFVLVILFTHFIDIPMEERSLANEFGDEYIEYRDRVRRYF